MISIVAVLGVSDAAAFEEFESQAIAILRSYGGKLVTAFEVEQSDSGVTEVHCLEFPDDQTFESYRNDSKLLALGELRAKAIHSTQIYVSSKHKEY